MSNGSIPYAPEIRRRDLRERPRTPETTVRFRLQNHAIDLLTGLAIVDGVGGVADQLRAAVDIYINARLNSPHFEEEVLRAMGQLRGQHE